MGAMIGNPWGIRFKACCGVKYLMIWWHQNINNNSNSRMKMNRRGRRARRCPYTRKGFPSPFVRSSSPSGKIMSRNRNVGDTTLFPDSIWAFEEAIDISTTDSEIEPRSHEDTKRYHLKIPSCLCVFVVQSLMNNPPSTTKTVLITGASSGIGLAAARFLAEHGFHVFAGVRRHESAAQIAAPRIIPVIIDITDVDSVARAAGQIETAVGDRGLDGLINNAGQMTGGPMEFVPIPDLRRIMEVNVIGQVAVTQAMLPLLRRAQGRIVNISSVSGRLAIPMFGPYNASKFALEAISDALRMELAGSGVKVVVIEPGPVKSRIWEKARDFFDQTFSRLPLRAHELYGPLIGAIKRVTAESEAGAIPAARLAALIHRALTTKNPATRYPIGRLAKSRDLAARLIPDKLRDRIILRILGLKK